MCNKKDVNNWLSEVRRVASVGRDEDVNAQFFMKSRAMTKEVMAKLLSTAFSIVKSRDTDIQNLETSLEECCCELSDVADENKRMKSECALEVVDLQRDVVRLQRELLTEKERQLSDLRATV